MIRSNLVIDCGSRSEKLYPASIGFDVQRVSDIQADACNLPFRNSAADCLVAGELIEHFDFRQITSFLKEARRVGKTLVISTPNVDSVSWCIAWKLWSTYGFGRKHWHGLHIGLYCKEFLDSMLSEYGFRILDFKKTRWSLFYLLERTS